MTAVPRTTFACAKPRSLVLAGLHIRSVRLGGEREEERGERRKGLSRFDYAKGYCWRSTDHPHDSWNLRLINYDAIESYTPHRRLHTSLSTEEDLMTALGERQNGPPKFQLDALTPIDGDTLLHGPPLASTRNSPPNQPRCRTTTGPTLSTRSKLNRSAR